VLLVPFQCLNVCTLLSRYSNRRMFILLNFGKKGVNILLICDVDSTSSAPNISLDNGSYEMSRFAQQ
jgi:hypothetical protein